MKIIIDKGGFMPERAYKTDAGLDIKSPIAFTLPARGSYIVPTKIHIFIPVGFVGFLKSKSGLNVNHGIVSEGVIDALYSGEIRCKLYNNSDKDYYFEIGDKITQIVIIPILNSPLQVVDEFLITERGDNGFGSTGR